MLVCVCVCARARAFVCVCVCARSGRVRQRKNCSWSYGGIGESIIFLPQRTSDSHSHETRRAAYVLIKLSLALPSHSAFSDARSLARSPSFSQ